MAPGIRLRKLRIPKNMQRNFIAGLIVLTPLVATVVIMKWLFELIDGILGPAFEPILGRAYPGAGFVAMLILIYLAGLIAANVLGKRAIRYGESWVQRLPLFGEVYNIFRQIIDSLMMSQKGGFKEAVLVEFPRPGMTTVGFVTNRVTDSSGRELLHVFIPTAPNPTSGFFQMIPPENVIRTKLSVEDAMKMVMSAGIVSPPVIELGGVEQEVHPNDATT
ncbi:MAG: DUF502 domain-containing protein [Dehalococcoidia bacterium]|nr:DUF502 domain-containing protein [Dehalococcoidia bacterium]